MLMQATRCDNGIIDQGHHSVIFVGNCAQTLNIHKAKLSTGLYRAGFYENISVAINTCTNNALSVFSLKYSEPQVVQIPMWFK